ncbi:LptF/LptG family permease [Blattabacterium cuenoti]|uniref:LptF/LptG family permease n=1 Tax=Blattabacterium cuenoti TaxID=1653831 RepID=UPI00163C2F8E|nr:LptF/LptG family permease [Blattabacterium cuenoti]
MKIIDRYIFRNFMISFIVITIFLQLLSVVIDISQRMHRLENNHVSIKEALIFYYPFWSIWLANIFSPISVLLSVIFFTYQLTKNSEITALLASGISLKRITFTYLLSAIFIVLISIVINYYILPIANKNKNKFFYQYLLSPKYKYEYHNVSAKISDNEYIFIRNFSKKKNTGKNFVYQKFIGNKLICIIKAKNILCSKKSKIYILHDYIETIIKKNHDTFFVKGFYKIKKLSLTPEEFLPEEYIAENMNIHELKKFIEIEKKRGNNDVNIYLNEFYQRINLPFSTFIFTILGLSISLKKRDIGLNIIIGIILSFIYIFLIKITKIYSTKNYIPSYFSVLLPNISFGIITLFYYYKVINNK